MVVGHGVLTGRNELLIHDNKVLRKILELLLSLLRISPWGLFRVRINFIYILVRLRSLNGRSDHCKATQRTQTLTHMYGSSSWNCLL